MSRGSHANDDRRKWLVLLAVGVGTFMSALDGSVVNTTLPVIRNAFASDVATIQWVVTTYLLVVSGLLLSVGRLGDMRGHKRFYVAGFVVFVVGSMACGLANSAGWLVGFRAAQAVGAAMIMANSPAILTAAFPATQRGQALGLQATMTYLGLTTGPVLGGWLAGWLGWRSVFYINVPVGATALLLSMLFIRPDVKGQSAEPFDLTGAGLFLISLVALLLALNQGHAWGWLSPAVLTLVAVAGLLGALFVRTERRVNAPMLDMRLFAGRLFRAATASALLHYVCIYTITFLMPFYLIQGRSLSSAQSGLILSAQPIVMAVTAPLSGTLSDRIGSRLLSTMGLSVLGLGLAVLSLLGPATPIGMILAGLALAGLGAGIFASPNTSAIMGAAPVNRQGIASGILATSRNVGMVLGVGFAGAIYTTMLELGENTPTALFAGIRGSFVGAVLVAIAGVAISATRGRKEAGY